MPFGVKPRNDGTDRTYNFDKVYRVIIQRAISNLKMKPLRADETEGSRIVHADMFKDLRDRPVVLVDLSLLNPNVMYELGIRHVMSSTGTILMANEETVKKLPFDIALSRTISYKYDGEHLDWDEVERVVPQLQAAIEEARRGTPDSPVYAFLEQVLSPNALKKDDILADDNSKNPALDLDDYQKKFAQIWIAQDNINLDKLIDEHNNSVFGMRSIGYYGLLAEKLEKSAKSKIADLLFNYEQYDLSAKIYQECDKSSDLDFDSLLYYGAAVSYAYPDMQGAIKGLKIIERARAMAKKKIDNNPSDETAQKEYSSATQQVTSMLSWIWSISREEKDLQKVIVELGESIRLVEELLDKSVDDVPLSRYAQNLLRYAMFLRIAENDPERMDVEKNFQKILSLKPGNELGPSASYLRWFQIFILADMGKYDDAQKRAQTAIALDIRYAMNKEETSVGRRQYSELRRLLEIFSRFWRDQKSIARVSQIINSAHLR
jgi:hypothetical protein